ncbi:MAG: response regulator [Archangium sp.]|nr:response regulator [Archangium sp.]
MNHLENPGRVLLVDDNAQLLAGLSRNLRRLVPVVTANSGDEALTLLKKDRDFSIIISDMRMPGMDGAEFFSEAKLLAPDAVRILLTGQADLTAVVNAINHGRIYRFISKPVDFDELRNIVSAAMAHFRLQQEERRQREAIERSVIDRAEDLLALSSLVAWGRAARVRRIARALAEHLGLRDVLSIESAAVLDAARACFDERCDARLVNAAVLSLAGSEHDDAAHVMLQELSAPKGLLRVGTRVVQVAIAVDGRAGPWGERVDALLREKVIDERFATALRDIESRLQPHAPHSVPVEELVAGMRLVEPLRTDAGVEVAPEGVRITPLVLARLAPLKLPARAVIASDLEAAPEFSTASA